MDPGLKGGVAVLDQDHRVVLLESMPLEHGVTRAVREVHVRQIRDLLNSVPGMALNPPGSFRVFVERVGAFKQGSRKGAFTFGRMYEALISLCKLEGWDYHETLPKDWQALTLRLTGKTKDATLAWAEDTWPHLDLGDSDGLADALGLAHYGWTMTKRGRFSGETSE